jgi:ceramide glucosyltransferase
MIPFTIILEPLSECLILGAIAALSVNYLFQWDALVFYLVHILVWFLLDWILLSTVQVGFSSEKKRILSQPFNFFPTKIVNKS